ncbi:DUF2513 domain-containing protein [Aliiroseovarius crassostreae]|uniref:DUF2513 domain-containing protein n=1 Tax=Aliiroseovarius crassostreae TaxID=154981 RepID=UPI00220E8781|nr:DUF2513 domain-containing protein [Aliiroseovarius crassostreae]UWQ10613.1 DUF2513 domain-containing protein [Aliiroseovarius crassostreae]
MKRDLDIIRSILEKVENSDDEWMDVFVRWPFDADIYDYPEESDWSKTERAHIRLLCDAGLVEVRQKYDSEYLKFEYAQEMRLTYNGHDYIAAIQDDGIWNRTKQAVAETGGVATVEVVKSLAMGFAKKKLSEHTGLEL